jgi:hypothetical protein
MAVKGHEIFIRFSGLNPERKQSGGLEPVLVYLTVEEC